MSDLIENEIKKERWAAQVESMLADHPDFAAVTVQAMQQGLLAAIERVKERNVTVSWGLMEATQTKPGHKRRDHGRIIEAVEASNFSGSRWATETIENERCLAEAKAKAEEHEAQLVPREGDS